MDGGNSSPTSPPTFFEVEGVSNEDCLCSSCSLINSWALSLTLGPGLEFSSSEKLTRPLKITQKYLIKHVDPFK